LENQPRALTIDKYPVSMATDLDALKRSSVAGKARFLGICKP